MKLWVDGVVMVNNGVTTGVCWSVYADEVSAFQPICCHEKVEPPLRAFGCACCCLSRCQPISNGFYPTGGILINEVNGFPAKGMGAEIPGLLAVAVLLPFKPGLRIWRTRLGTRAFLNEFNVVPALPLVGTWKRWW